MLRPLAALALAVCVTAPAGAQPLTGTLKKIKDSGAIALGHRDSSVPFSYVGADGKPTGYSVELCQRVAASIARELGIADLKVAWVPVTVDTRTAAVTSGRIDLECGSTTATLGRQREVDFSNMTFVDGGGLLVAAGSAIGGVADLGARRVAVIPGTTTEQALREAIGKRGVAAAVVPVKDHAEGLAALERGQAEAYASDRAILFGLLTSARDPSRLGLAEEMLSYEPYGLMLRRGDADFRLAVNRALARIYRTDEIWEIYRRWFGKFGRPGSMLVAMYLLNGLPE
jgi:ABC-type amino acid transport substrate-binding protein